jgi:hypothetical protein
VLPFLSERLMALFQRGLGDRRTRRSSHLSSVFLTAARIWSEVAEARGLEAVDDPMRRELRYAGAIRGMPCELALLDVGEGFVTVLRVEKAELRGEVRVVPRAPLASLAHRLLGRRHVTGDEAFDAAFLTTSTSVRAASATLDTEARAALLAVAHRLPVLELGRGGLALQMQGVELGHDALLALLDALVRAPASAAMPYR